MTTEDRISQPKRPNARGAQAPPAQGPLEQAPQRAARSVAPRIPATPTATIYCEGNFAKIDGKTANGLVRHSQAYRIVSVIDSTHDGRDSGEVLDEARNGIPVLADIEAAIVHEAVIPDTLIYGMAPSDGKLSPTDRGVVLDAIALGMNIVSGLHEYLGDDPEIAEAAKLGHVTIRDIRKPRPAKDMRLFDGSIADVPAIRIAVLGTDCAIGKRTTATILTDGLNKAGVKTILIGTGQTGLMQGARYGVAMDAVPPQFCCGELERVICAASRDARPEVIVIEGQGALSHPAFCTSAFILRGSQPQAVILQHAPARKHRCDFPTMTLPDPAREIALIEAFAKTRVIGVTINHEHMTETELAATMTRYCRDLALPVTDALARPAADLATMVLDAYPGLQKNRLLVAQ